MRAFDTQFDTKLYRRCKSFKMVELSLFLLTTPTPYPPPYIYPSACIFNYLLILSFFNYLDPKCSLVSILECNPRPRAPERSRVKAKRSPGGGARRIFTGFRADTAC